MNDVIQVHLRYIYFMSTHIRKCRALSIILFLCVVSLWYASNSLANPLHMSHLSKAFPPLVDFKYKLVLCKQ